MGRLGDERPGERDPRSAVRAWCAAPCSPSGIAWRVLRGCASTGAVPRPFPVSGIGGQRAGRPGHAVDAALRSRARRIGRLAPTRPASTAAVSCSTSSAQHGVVVPRNVAGQFRSGRTGQSATGSSQAIWCSSGLARRGVARRHRRGRRPVRSRAERAWDGAGGVARRAVLGDAIRGRAARGQSEPICVVATGAGQAHLEGGHYAGGSNCEPAEQQKEARLDASGFMPPDARRCGRDGAKCRPGTGGRRDRRW